MQRFKHEEIEANIKRAERDIKRYKAELSNIDKQQFAATVWQVATEGELIILDVTQRSAKDLYTDKWSDTVKFKIDGITQWQFEEIMDEFDYMLEAEGFVLDMDRSRFCEWSRSYDFEYWKDNKMIRIEFASKSCKQVATGRMIAEKKSVCALFAA